LVVEYVKTFTERYYDNILHACFGAVDFDEYDDISILSIGCGVSPDLMAFEKLISNANIHYVGVDDNELWNVFHDIICTYTHGTNVHVNYYEQSAFKSGKTYSDFYNIIVMQFFMSSVLGEGGRKRHIIELFEELINGPLLRWYNSQSTTPFLFILNDNDSVFTGRKQFYDLLDMLVDNGYQGKAIARSKYIADDMNDRRNRGFDRDNFKTSNMTTNNRATLTIEVVK
jgi:hypothetical protein